ncbi:MAG: endonuclease [Leptospiraceae bacterium]|nr:MAG: endonuclease [Leptospiraceae bacterium]
MLFKLYKKLLKYYGKQNWWPILSKQNPKIEIIFGAILTQNTSWKNVEKALKNLIEHQLLDFNKILSISEELVKNLIKPAGFYNQKAKTLRNVAKYFTENHNSISRESLLKIKGIGKETADSILLYAYNQPYFIIDAYTKRFLSRLGYIKESISYDELQSFITNHIPNNIEIYKEFHALIVVHCKNFCKKTPDCITCFLKVECQFYKKTY